jgi:hypothetical protein
VDRYENGYVFGMVALCKDCRYMFNLPFYSQCVQMQTSKVSTTCGMVL